MGAKQTANANGEPEPLVPAAQTSPEWQTRLLATLDALPDLLFVLDRRGNVLDFHAPNRIGLYSPPERFLGRNAVELLPEPAATVVREALAEALATGHHQGGTYALAMPGGERWFELSVAAHGDPQADDARLVAIARDVTDRKRAEDALRESEGQYRLLTESMKDVVWVLDVEAQRFTYVSPSVKNLRGFTAEEILAQPLAEAWAPEEREKLFGLMQGYVADFLAGKIDETVYVPIEFHQPCKDGSIVPSEAVCHLVRNRRTGRLELHGVTRDVSARKQIENALRESETRFAETARQSRAFVWEVDADGRYMFVTPVVEDVLGYRPDEIAGRLHFYDLHPAESRAEFRAAALAVMRRHEKFLNYENPMVAKDGRTTWVSTNAIPLLDKNGALLGYRGIDFDVTARKQAEEALKASEARQRQLFDFAVDGILLGSPDGVVTDANACMCALAGRTRRELIGKHVTELFDPQTMAETPMRFDLVHLGETVTRVRKLVRPDASEVFVEIHSKRMPDGTIQSIYHDISQRKQAEEALRLSEAKYRNLHETMRDAFVAADLQGRIQDFNPAFRKLTGYSAAELRNMSYRRLTPRKWHAAEAKILRDQVLARGYSDVYEKEYRRKNGTVVPVELRTILIRDAAGRPTGMWASLRDVAERKRAETELRQAHAELERRVRERTAELESSREALARSEEQFREMAENAKDAFWLIDARTLKVLYVSPAFERIWNRPVEMDAARWFAHVHPDDRAHVLRAFRSGLRTGIPATVTYRLIWPDGSIRWIESSGAMIRDARNRPNRAAGLIRDITDQRRLEAEILQAAEAERQRIGRDLHDSLGQALTAIGYLADAVREDLTRAQRPEADDVRKLGRLIGQTASDAHALARGLLLADVKRGGLAAALQELAFRTQELFGVVCPYSGPATLPPLDVHAAGQLYRIAQEAAANAAKHSRAQRIEIRLAKERRGLLLSVRDNGRGLPARKNNAPGLGLDIMRYRAGLIGATLWIDTQPRRGTTVKCLLPRAAPVRKKKR